MNNKLKMILLSALTLMLMGCPMIDSESENIKIVNQSDKEIYFQDNTLTYPFANEDTLLQSQFSIVRIKPRTHDLCSAATNSDWRRELHGCRFLQILIVENGDDFLKYLKAPEDTLRKYVPVVQRYHLSVKDLDRLHWTVTYPPTEDMKGVNMWPPYKK